MDFNVEEFDEYIVSDDDEEEVKNIEVEVNLKKELTPQKNNAENSSRPCLSSPSVNLSNRAGSMIFKPFRPGQKHSAFEQFPKSVIEITVHRPFNELNQRKLPQALKETKDKLIEEQKKKPAPVQKVTEEAKQKDAKIKEILANLPSFQTQIQENRQRIQQMVDEESKKGGEPAR